MSGGFIIGPSNVARNLINVLVLLYNYADWSFNLSSFDGCFEESWPLAWVADPIPVSTKAADGFSQRLSGLAACYSFCSTSIGGWVM